MKTWLLRLGAAVGILVGGGLRAGTPAVCSQCGYELDGTANVCSHCGDAAADGPTETSGRTDRLGFLEPRVVEDETDLARQMLKKGDREVARYLLRNALALDLLTDPARAGERSKAILKTMRAAGGTGGEDERTCPICKGSGLRTVNRADPMARGQTVMEMYEASCPKCDGSGSITRSESLDERRFRMGRAWRRYTTLQQSRKFAAVGRAWLPADLKPRLTVRQVAVLKQTVAAACEECAGAGRLACKKCKSKGELKCANRGCVNGVINRKTSDQAAGEKCNVCGGSGTLACVDCGGSGDIVCKDCDGTGERSPCAKCGGEGVSECRRCKGTGEDRGETCLECAGEGVVQCSSCNGDGRRR